MAASNRPVEQGAPLTPTPQYDVHEKQRAVLESDARYRVLCWGRRAGKNITGAIDTIEYARSPSSSQWGSDTDATVWWVGPTYDQANDHGFDTIEAGIPNAWIDGEPKRTKPRRIELINGVTIDFRTFDRPESLQGAGVDRMVIDEVAYMPRSLWDNDLEPMLMDNMGSAVFISKPKGRGLFHEMYQKGQSDDFPNHESFHATSADNPFIDADPMEKRDEKPDHVFKQEYLAEFIDESGGVFEELDDRLFTAESELPADGGGPYAIGVDFARHQDYRVTIVLDATGDVVFFDRGQNEAWPHIQADIEDVADDYPGIVRVDGSRDNKIVADLADAGVNVEPVTFSPSTKRDLIENLVARVENGELSAPEISQLRHELQIFEYDVSPSGTVSYHAPEGFHDDCVDSLALAASALDRVAAAARRHEHRDDETDNGISYL
jgi:hypothetical protein